MMKLRNLVDDRATAKTILDMWSFHDIDYEVMDEYRRSATAIYPFIDDGNVYILRFSPEDEKSKSFIESELDYINYLRSAGINVPKTVTSRQGNTLETVVIDDVKYYANVFERVRGQRVDRIALDHSHYFKLGQSLGKLHLASEKYRPSEGKRIRPDYKDKLKWAKNVLISQYQNGQSCHEKALEVIEILESKLDYLPKGQEHFGLIHYDYDLDNIFYDDEKENVWIIDFDDAIYHWYYLDLLNFHDSLKDDLPQKELEDAMRTFNEGYESVKSIDPSVKAYTELLKKYSECISYAAFVYSTSEMTKNPPQWMLDIKKKLDHKMTSKRKLFVEWLE